VTQVVQRAALATMGEQGVDSSEAVLTTGSDDMAYFLEAVPGCYFIVGARNPEKGAKYPHHHPRFNIDEDALPVAVETLTRATFEFLGE
jgi:amidohydrolase